MGLTMRPGPTTLVYDGDCGLCTATAAWLGRRVAPDRLRLTALADAASDSRLRPLLAGRNLAATLHVLTPDDRVLTGARAVLAAGRLVPGWRVLARIADRGLGHRLLEPVYRQVARHRRAIGRLLRLPASCPMPATEDRPR